MSDLDRNLASPLEGEGLRGDGVAKWYVVHTYSGHENKVKMNIEKIVENRGMQDLILDIVVPTEDRVEIKNGQRKVKTRKMFPGYVIVKMIVTNESWYLVRNTQGVTGFVGHGSEPIPLSNEEVARMGIEKVFIDLDVEVGDSIRVISGPFEGFMDFCKQFNAKTQDQPGMIIPVVITVYADRSFSFICKTPPAAVLIKKAAGLDKASGEPNKNKVGKITLAQAQEIAQTKMPDLNAANLESATEMIKGTARSMGILVEE